MEGFEILITDNLKEDRELLAKTKELNIQADSTYIALGMALLQVEETKAYEGSYQTFAEYYQNELNRDKSTISRLLSVAQWVRQSGFTAIPQEVGYNNLYESIKALPTETPEYVLEFAKQNTLQEIRDEKREKDHGVHEHEPDVSKKALFPCLTCGKLCKDD